MTHLLNKPLAVMLSVAILLSGCATVQLPHYQERPPDQATLTQVKDGLSVTIRPMTDKKEIAKYFGADLLSLNLLPVHISAKNESSSSVVVAREEVSLKILQSRSPENLDRTPVGVQSQAQRAGSQAEGASTALLVLGTLTMPLGLAIFMPMIGKKSSDAAEISYHFATNELQTVTLSPGESIAGFVYFDIPGGQDMPSQLPINIKANDLKSGGIRNFDFLFTWAKEGSKA